MRMKIRYNLNHPEMDLRNREYICKILEVLNRTIRLRRRGMQNFIIERTDDEKRLYKLMKMLRDDNIILRESDKKLSWSLNQEDGP